MKTQHTPTPWRKDKSWTEWTVRGSKNEVIIDQAGPYDTPILSEPNANFIIRAVNAHEDLVAACQRVLDVLQDGSIDYDDQTVIEDMHDTLRNALSKAKGES